MYIFQWKTQKKFIALTKWVLTQSCWTFCHRIILSFTFSIIMVDTVGLITQSVFMHPKLKRKVSYRTALKLDCYKLIKNILEEKEFVPFSLKEGM